MARKVRELNDEINELKATMANTEDRLRLEEEQCRHAKQRMDELEGIERQVLGLVKC